MLQSMKLSEFASMEKKIFKLSELVWKLKKNEIPEKALFIEAAKSKMSPRSRKLVIGGALKLILDGIDKEACTISTCLISERLKNEFGLVVSRSTVHRHLKDTSILAKRNRKKKTTQAKPPPKTPPAPPKKPEPPKKPK